MFYKNYLRLKTEYFWINPHLETNALDNQKKYFHSVLGHTINACLNITIGLVYEVAMTAIFLVDDTLTSYKNSFIHDNFLYFAFNLTVVLPRSFRAHTLAAICPSTAYSLDDSLNNTLEEQPLENMTSKIVDLALFVFLQKLLMIT